ncbi:THUMP domain-containing protein [Flavobacteriales bacterium]|nr:THUMP domain-containing protein [Flavobacteriales bacterium]
MAKYTIKTLHGLEEVLCSEINALGGSNVKPLKRAVSCEGDLEFLYKANIGLRTAVSILKPIHRFRASNEDQLYRGVKSIDWTAIFDVRKRFAITASVHSNHFNHSKYVALKSKDAIVDQFREKFGSRPSIEIENPAIKINIHIARDQVTVSLDSSGDTLNKRGYRKEGVFAPLNEVLAAGMIALSGWDKKTDFVDPMCGSGTILIEAAMMAKNIAPNINRDAYCFKNWKDFNPTLYKKVITQAKLNTIETDCQFFGSDISDKNLRIAVQNSFKAGIGRAIKFENCDARELHVPFENGIAITNPPYGERLRLDDMNAFYKELSDAFKNHFEGYDVWLISSNMEAIKHIRLKTSRKITLFNGSLECKFNKYEMYRGTKKVRPQLT